MTRDELLTLLREAGMWASSGEFLDSRQGKFLERFAQLVAEKEREECYHAVRGASLRLDGVALTAKHTMAIYEQLSSAIRARKP